MAKAQRTITKFRKPLAGSRYRTGLFGRRGIGGPSRRQIELCPSEPRSASGAAAPARPREATAEAKDSAPGFAVWLRCPPARAIPPILAYRAVTAGHEALAQVGDPFDFIPPIDSDQPGRIDALGEIADLAGHFTSWLLTGFSQYELADVLGLDDFAEILRPRSPAPPVRTSTKTAPRPRLPKPRSGR